jgi:two-component system, NarL family, invasion response regulator UvrY
MVETQGKIVKIALVDDHVLVREGLVKMVNNFPGCNVILLAGNGKELQQTLKRDNLPDLVILDINMPDMDGYETAEWLHDEFPKICVLVLTMYDSELAMLRMLKKGVRGYLIKDIHPSELRRAIETIMQGGYSYSDKPINKLERLLKAGDERAAVNNTVLLTEVEMRFLKLASTEKTYKEIAMEMKITPRTVDYYRDTLFAKLKVTSRVGLVMYAINNGVVTTGS